MHILQISSTFSTHWSMDGLVVDPWKLVHISWCQNKWQQLAVGNTPMTAKHNPLTNLNYIVSQFSLSDCPFCYHLPIQKKKLLFHLKQINVSQLFLWFVEHQTHSSYYIKVFGTFCGDLFCFLWFVGQCNVSIFHHLSQFI